MVAPLVDFDLSLEMLVRPSRPSEPTVVYVANGDHLWRLDVNGAHRGPRFTHVQTRTSSQAEETTVAVDLATVVLPFGPDPVSGATYRAVFEAAARLCRVDVSTVMWVDPPGGVR